MNNLFFGAVDFAVMMDTGGELQPQLLTCRENLGFARRSDGSSDIADLLTLGQGFLNT